MSFTVANFGGSEEIPACGQSFTPIDQGPDGTGDPADWPPYTLKRFTIGFPDGDQSQWTLKCYLYSAPLQDPSQIGSGVNLLGESTGFNDGSKLGSGSTSRSFGFALIPVDLNTTYYVYFDNYPQAVNAQYGAYAGGNLYDSNCDPSGDTLQFMVDINYGS